MIRVLLLFTMVLSEVGCIYTRASVNQRNNGVYENYPASVAAERERRSSRRKWALIASPLEILGGVGIAALALYAPVTHMNEGDESVIGNLGEAGKEAASRLLVAAAGGVIALSGVGDLALGATDPLRSSPYVRHGELIPADRVDHIAPLAGPRVDFHLANSLGTHGVGLNAGLGLSHWVGDRVRLRHSVSGAARNRWGDHAKEGGGIVETNAELAFGRKHGGLEPAKSIGIYAGTGIWSTDMGKAPIATGGLSFDFGRGQYRLGTTYVVGVDRMPSIDLDLRLTIGGD